MPLLLLLPLPLRRLVLLNVYWQLPYNVSFAAI